MAVYSGSIDQFILQFIQALYISFYGSFFGLYRPVSLAVYSGSIYRPVSVAVYSADSALKTITHNCYFVRYF